MGICLALGSNSVVAIGVACVQRVLGGEIMEKHFGRLTVGGGGLGVVFQWFGPGVFFIGGECWRWRGECR